MKYFQSSRLATAIACTVATIAAQTAFIGQISAAEIEEIVITGDRLEETIPQDLARYGNRVEVITAEEK